MLTSTDQGHFFKYLTTLGVAVIVASLGIGGLFLQTQNDLLIDQNKIHQITGTARAAIDKKQQTILLLTQLAPWLMIALVVIGITLIITGLIGWKKRQDTLDEKDRAELSKTQAEVRQMTEQEKEQKALGEAAEILDAAQNTDDQAPHPSVDEQPGSNSDTSDEAPSGSEPVESPSESISNATSPRISELATKVLSLERELVSKLKGSYGIFSSVRSSFTATHPESGLRLEADALVADTANKRLYIFDLKLYRSKVSAEALTRTALQLAAVSEAMLNWYPDFEITPVIVAVADGIDLKSLEPAIRTFSGRIIGLKHKPVIVRYTLDGFRKASPQAFRKKVDIARNSAARKGQ